MARANRLLAGGVVGAASRGIAIAAGYLHLLLLAQERGGGAVGRLAIGFAIVNIGGTISRLGADSALTRLGSIAHDGRDPVRLRQTTSTAYFIALIGSLTLAIPLALLAQSDFLSWAIPSDLADEVRIAALGIAPLGLIAVSAASLRTVGGVVAHVVVRFGLSPVLAAGWFAVSAVGLNRSASATQLYVESLFIGALASIVISQRFMGRVTQNPSRQLHTLTERIRATEFLRISVPMLMASAGFVLLSWIDSIMLASHVSDTELGGYSVAMRLAASVEVPLVIAASVTNAEFATRFSNGETHALSRLAQTSATMAFAVALPVCVLLLAFPERILSLFDSDFTTVKTALILLVLGRLMSAAVGSVGGILTMTNAQNQLQWIVAAAVATNVAMNALLIPAYGATGAAIAQLAAIALWNLGAAGLIYLHHGFWAGCSPSSVSYGLRKRLK